MASANASIWSSPEGATFDVRRVRAQQLGEGGEEDPAHLVEDGVTKAAAAVVEPPNPSYEGEDDRIATAGGDRRDQVRLAAVVETTLDTRGLDVSAEVLVEALEVGAFDAV